LLVDWLPIDFLHKFFIVMPPALENGSDTCIWLGSRKGEYKVSIVDSVHLTAVMYDVYTHI